MPAPTIDQTEEAIAHALGIARRLVDDATWLHNEAYLPRGVDRNRPTRIIVPRPEDAAAAEVNPDHQPGARDDLGLPTDAVLRRYHQAAMLVAQAARLSAIATAVTAGEEPPPRWTGAAAVGAAFGPAVRAATGRLQALRHQGLSGAPERARRAAWASASHLIEAGDRLRAAMPNPLNKPDPPADRRCKNCKEPHIEPDRTSDVECAPCRMWRRRHNGEPRPYRRNADALAALDRRRERGEGHGSEDGGVQNGAYRETSEGSGEWGWEPHERPG